MFTKVSSPQKHPPIATNKPEKGNPMPTFADIQEEIASMLEIADEDLTEEQQAAMDAYLDELASQEADKVDSFAQFIRFQSDRAKACKNESRRLAERAKAAERRIDWLKSHYASVMLANGLKKIGGNIYTLSLRKSESVDTPPDPSVLDKSYLRVKTTIEPDKQLIKEALKNGRDVPGCRLAENFSLQIR